MVSSERTVLKEMRWCRRGQSLTIPQVEKLVTTLDSCFIQACLKASAIGRAGLEEFGDVL